MRRNEITAKMGIQGGEEDKLPTPTVPRKTQMQDMSYLSEFIFLWVTPYMKLGASRPLEYDDVDELPDLQRMKSVHAIVEELWLAEKKEKKALGQKPLFSTALRKAFFMRYVISALWSFPYCVIVLVQPYLITKVSLQSITFIRRHTLS